jgi:ComF family protein
MIKRVLASLANYILPYRCSSCSQLIDKEQGMCAPCFSKLNFITSPYCSCCGFPFEFFIEGQNLCGRCVAKQPNYDLARSLFKFDLESKKLIHAFKYNDRTAHSKMFAKLIIARYKQEIEEVDLVIPVPMHRIKRIFRQYNPAQILAKDIADSLKIPMVPDVLIKTKWTKPQTKLTKYQREKNLSGSLVFNIKRIVKGMRVLLVDDVKTTGTTCNTCAKLLKTSGAISVKLVTVGMT